MKNLLLALIATILVFGSCSKTKNGRDGYVRMKHLTILFLFVLVFLLAHPVKRINPTTSQATQALII